MGNYMNFIDCSLEELIRIENHSEKVKRKNRTLTISGNRRQKIHRGESEKSGIMNNRIKKYHVNKYQPDRESTANKIAQSSAKFKALERRLPGIDNKHINVAKNPRIHTPSKYNSIFVSNLGDQVSLA